MMTLFERVPREGQPLPRGFAKWCRDIDRAVCRMAVDGGVVMWGMGVPTIVPATSLFPDQFGGGGGFLFFGSGFRLGFTGAAFLLSAFRFCLCFGGSGCFSYSSSTSSCG
jgi:hypothetical protein